MTVSRSGGRGESCFVPILTRRHLLSMMLADGFFVDTLYQGEVPYNA